MAGFMGFQLMEINRLTCFPDTLMCLFKVIFAHFTGSHGMRFSPSQIPPFNKDNAYVICSLFSLISILCIKANFTTTLGPSLINNVSHGHPQHCHCSRIDLEGYQVALLFSKC